MKPFRSYSPTPFAKSALIVSLGTMVLISAAAIEGGKQEVEKILTEFALPTGLMWGTIWFLALWLWFDKRYRFACVTFAILTIYTIPSIGICARMISDLLESRYSQVDIRKCEMFDYVVLMGGGVKATSPTDFQATCAGDRIVLATRLFHAGKVKKLITTGTHFSWTDSDLPPQSQVAKRLFVDLNVPESSIEFLEGRNTFEELNSLSKKLKDAPNLRIGIVTSATHMPRVTRLAKSHGIDFVPLPADFERTPPGPLVLDLIPSYASLARSNRSIKEFLAAIVSR